jgi:uncharacterized protein with HEPN domain
MCTDHPLNTFVIRFWQRSEEDSPGWIGQVQHTQSKEYRFFSDLTTLQDFFSEFGVVLTSRNHLIYLEALLGALDRLEMSAAEEDFEKFKENLKTNPAVLRSVVVIGLAAKRLPGMIRYHIPNIPWQEVAKTFSAAANNFDDFHLQRLWQIVKEDIPDIKDSLEQFLRSNHSNIE